MSQRAMPTYPHGFPEEIIRNTRGLLGVRCCVTALYSGTDVIRDYGEQAQKNGGLIVYTSADSVFQVAAHEETVPVEELYRCCRLARKLMTGEHGVGRIIARPFVGEPGSYVRTSNRHDFSLDPPGDTLFDRIIPAGAVYAVGWKDRGYFRGTGGVTEAYRTETMREGIERAVELTRKDFNGLCFVNLVDFDMIYGHRNDAKGYAQALSYFDRQFPRLLEGLGPEDLFDDNGRPWLRPIHAPLPIIPGICALADRREPGSKRKKSGNPSHLRGYFRHDIRVFPPRRLSPGEKPTGGSLKA